MQTSQNDEVTGRSSQSTVRFKQGDKVGNRFVIDERLREDIVGSTYRAVDERTGKKIAVLMLAASMPTNAAITEQIRSDIDVASKISQKNIAHVYGMGTEGKGKPRYVAQEWIDGQNLISLIEQKAASGKGFSIRGAYNVVANLCNALTASSLPHGTLRPSAVLLTKDGRVKLVELGLARLRPSLCARREHLGAWDSACFPKGENAPGPDPSTRGDLYALGVLFYCMLVGKPFIESIATEEINRRLPPALGSALLKILEQKPGVTPNDPQALKRMLADAVEKSAGYEMPGEPVEAQQTSIEAMDTSAMSAINDSNKQRSSSFVIPELKPAGGDPNHDDGQRSRWLVEKNGIDFGPYTGNEIREKLLQGEISTETILCDVETDRRLTLSEFPNFDDILVQAIQQKVENDSKQEEKRMAHAANKRVRVALGVFTSVIILAVLAVAGWFGYQAMLPAPAKTSLDSAVMTFTGSLPSISLPEELPETPAEIAARRQQEKLEAAQRFAQAEARQMAREERLVAQSEMSLRSGTGRSFDKSEFDRVVQSRMSALTKCLEDEARRDPSKKDFAVNLTIVPDGSLLKVSLSGGSSSGNRCVRSALSGLKVPSFDGSNYNASLPFNVR